MFSENFVQSIFPTKFSDQYFLPIFVQLLCFANFMFFGKFRPVMFSEKVYPVNIFRQIFSDRYFLTNFD